MVPPVWPVIDLHAFVGYLHSWRRCPAWPKGASRVRPSPVPNPSKEIEKLWDRTWDTVCLLGLGSR
jgi:hypothetical protein